MEAYRQEIILFSVLAYMVFCVVVGLWAMRKTKSASDFFVAGRNLGPWVLSLAIFSSTLSGFGFVGGPGLVYSSGASSFWMILLSTASYSLGFILVAKRIRMLAEVHNAISLPDIIAARYQNNVVRFLSAITIVLGVLGYLATQILAMGMVLQSLLSETDLFRDISLISCLTVSSLVLIFYCVTGGIIASVYTDVVQGTIMVCAGVLIFITAAGLFDGGLQEASTIIMADDMESMMPFGTMGIVMCLGWFFVFGVGLAAQPHVSTKMMMNRSINDNRIILPVTVIAFTLAALLWVSIGMVMRASVINGDIPALDAPDSAAPLFLSMFTNPILAGLVFAGLFAAIMSTSDAFLNIGTAAIIHDVPKAIIGRAVKNELFWARVVTVLLATLATGFALFSYYHNDRLVALLGAFGWATFAAALFPVVAIGLNWKGGNATGAIVAISTSLAINFGIEIFAIRLPYGLGGGHIAFVVSIILFICVSLLTTKPKLSPEMERVMSI